MFSTTKGLVRTNTQVCMGRGTGEIRKMTLTWDDQESLSRARVFVHAVMGEGREGLVREMGR